MDAVALKEKAKAEAKAELTAHDPTHAPKDEVALKRTSQSDIPASIYPCDEIELKRKHERDAEQDHTAGVAKKRPRGLKKRGQGSTDKGVQVEQGYERMELPAEVSVAAEGDERIQLESDSAHDAYALYASAMVEVEKDNTPTAKKFFEGAIHGLQALLEVKEKTNDLADNLHLYTLGMAWCELGVLIDDTDYIGRGLQYLGDVIGSGTAAAHVYMDAGQMTLSRYSLIHKTQLDSMADQVQAETDAEGDEASDRVDIPDEETEKVTCALTYLRKGVELQGAGDKTDEEKGMTTTTNGNPTVSSDVTPQSLAELAAKYVVNYSQALDGDWRRQVLSAAMDFFRDSTLVDSTGAWQFNALPSDECLNMLGFFLDYAECCAAAEDFDAAVKALVSGARCLASAEADDSGDDKPITANILKQVSDMHVIAGNVYAEAEEAQWEGNYPPLRKQSETDSDSSNSELQYQHAYTVIQKARDLDAGSVPDDLFESISSLVEEAEAESDDEE